MRSPLLAAVKAVQHAFGGSGLGRVKPVRALYDLVYGWFKPDSVQVQGHRMWLDDKDTLELATREVYEPMETALLVKELRKGDVFVDIGANIGYYTLIAARAVGESGRVRAFEPDPANFKLLVRNVAANGYSNADLMELAVSDREGDAKLYLNETNRGDHRIYDAGEKRGAVPIRTVTLDGYFKKLDKRVDFIKMDVQGAEALALAGMKGLLRRNRKVKLLTEFDPGHLRNCGSDAARFLSDLREAGFKLFEVSEKEKTVKPASDRYLLERYGAGNGEYTNLFCVK